MRTAPRSALLAVVALAALAAAPRPGTAQTRVGDLTVRPGDVPRRLVGYGLVVGLDGTGDRSFGTLAGSTFTVRSIVNLLRRFNIEVPAQQLRPRNVAAVLVTAELSPYLRAGGRFEVQVAALGDAMSLRGGVLWMTPLVAAPGEPPAGTAQGPVFIAEDERTRSAWARRANSGRIAEGGVLEVDPPAAAAGPPRLLLRQPDLGTAQGIAVAVNAAFGAGTAAVEDPGAVRLAPGARGEGDVQGFLAAVDTVLVVVPAAARVVIDARDGTVVAGGGAKVGAAVVSHGGITLQIGGAPPGGTAPPEGLVRVAPQASVQDVAAGLHAAGARPGEIAAIFEALRSAGALRAQVVVR
jgi:flagellar P-ring protein precursor FlgI